MLGRIIALILLVAMAGALIWQYRVQYAVLEQHEQKKKEAVASQVSLQQLQCEQSALTRFRALGMEGHPGAKYTGRFNTALNQCYELVEYRHSATGTDWMNATLYDVDGKVFATYGWHSDSDRPAAEISPYSCDVTMPTGERRTCGSEAEFRKLADAYMQ